MNPIENNARKVLKALFENNPNQDLQFSGEDIQLHTGLEPIEINDAINFLDKRGFLERLNYMGTSPYLFGQVSLNADGNYRYYEERNIETENNNLNIMKVFVSHSHKDVDIAKGLIELLRGALNLKVEEIRCTSVDGYRLPAGTTTDDQLKMEIHESSVLIGLISPASISSYYVLFELGARWGANKPLIPLISSDKGAELLKGPLSGINALNAKEEGQLFQLVIDIAKILKVTPENPQSYQVHIKKLIDTIRGLENGIHEPPPEHIVANTIDYSDSDDKIKNHCKEYWPNDFSMQVNCIKEQKQAVELLRRGKPNDISEDDFVLIRKKAEEDWPNDYTMRVNQEKEQFDAIRKLRAM